MTHKKDENVEPDRNIALIDELLAHPYFLYKVEQEAEARSRDYLRLWWKIISGALAVIIAILTFIGYREFTDLAKKKAELVGDVTKVQSAAAAADEGISKLEKTGKQLDSEIAGKRDEFLRQSNQQRTEYETATNRLFDGYSSFLQSSEAASRNFLDDVKKETAQAVMNATKATTDAQSLVTQAGDNIKEINGLRAKFDQVYKESVENFTDFEKTRFAELNRRAKQADRLTTLETSLVNAKSFDFIMLES